MAWIELGTIVLLFGGMALVFGWLELREKRRIHAYVEALMSLVPVESAPDEDLHEIPRPDREILTHR
jgi:hypothetical protein